MSLAQKKMDSVKSDELMDKIREACALMGIRQKDLADYLDMKPSQMNLYFRGKVEMRSDRLITLLGVLGIDIEELLSEKIRALGGSSASSNSSENKMLASLGRLDDYKKQSLLKIIGILGAK